MSDTKRQFREALIYIKKRSGYPIHKLAKIGGCSSRHIQSAISEKENRGISGTSWQKIAEHFGLSYGQMLDIGELIIEGEDPKDHNIKISISSSTEDRHTRVVMQEDPRINNELIDTSQKDRLLVMTEVVLDSESINGRALAASIRASYKSITGEKEMNEEIRRLREEIGEIRRMISTALGIDNGEKRDIA